jgi:hypothetical protein
MSQERYEDLNLVPPEEGFELYRYKHAERMSTRGWSGLYWARKNEAGDYEILTVTKEGEGYSYPGDVFSKEAFERFYEKLGFNESIEALEEPEESQVEPGSEGQRLEEPAKQAS